MMYILTFTPVDCDRDQAFNCMGNNYRPVAPGGAGGAHAPPRFFQFNAPPPLRFRHNTHNDMYAGRGFATSGTTYIVWVIECGL